MHTLILTAVGFVVQVIGLVTFVALANTSWSESGKPLVLGATILGMALLLVIANRSYRFSRSVIQSALLTLGYVLAHYTLGMLYFSGLLKDVATGSIEHLRTIAATSGLLFSLYLAGSFAAGLFNKFMQNRMKGARTQHRLPSLQNPFDENTCNSFSPWDRLFGQSLSGWM